MAAEEEAARMAAEAEAARMAAEAEAARIAAEEAANAVVRNYTVEAGDNLWNISGKADIYDNPFQWPLIYKANRDQIDDADLIFPGQNLEIDRDISDAEMDAAISHAKTRGAWSLETIEESDKVYLSE
jgi:nucleoid-associated protein YgaU